MLFFANVKSKFFTLAWLFFLLHSEIAIASPIRQITQSQALGKTEIIPIIHVWIGSGINLNFLETGEKIERVWLDDPSRLVVDFDDPNCHQGNCSAMVIHLKRINPVNFPELPKSNSTLLSVITYTENDRKLYQFKIAYGQGNPEYYTVSIIPQAPSAPPLPGLKSEPSIELTIGGRATLVDVERGLSIAKSKGLISSDLANQTLEYRVLEFISLARNGLSVAEASAQAGVSLRAIARLGELGKSAIFDRLKQEEVDIHK